MNSSFVVWSRANFQVISAMQSSSPCTKTRKKSQIAPTLLFMALHGRKNPCSRVPKQIGTQHRWRPSNRNPVWVQSQQEHHRHGVCPQTAPRKMQGAEQRTICTVCGLDQSVWHCEQKGTVDDHGVLWLSPKVPQHGYPTGQRPARPS